jgi:hypothetical protein
LLQVRRARKEDEGKTMMQLKRAGRDRSKSAGRPAGMQAIDPMLYQQICQAVQELARPGRRSAAHTA